MSILVLEEVVGGVVCAGSAAGLASSWLIGIRKGLRDRRVARRAQVRVREASNAATEASLEQEAFAPETIYAALEGMLNSAATVWGSAAAPPNRGPHGGLLVSWAEDIARDLGPGLRLTRSPRFDVLRVTNRAGEHEDRAYVRVRLDFRRARGVAPGEPRRVTADERWTLARSGSSWHLISIDDEPLAAQVLDGPLVTGHWADEERVREEALIEIAAADRVPVGTELADLVPDDLPAWQKLGELATTDSRFAPDLIAARLGHIVEAWEAASGGSQQPLAALSSSDALSSLTNPASALDGTRLIVRDANLDSWNVLDLDLSGKTTVLTIDLTVSAFRFLVSDPGGSYVLGSTRTRSSMRLVWHLGLEDDGEAAPWRLRRTTDPAQSMGAVGA